MCACKLACVCRSISCMMCTQLIVCMCVLSASALHVYHSSVTCFFSTIWETSSLNSFLQLAVWSGSTALLTVHQCRINVGLWFDSICRSRQVILTTQAHPSASDWQCSHLYQSSKSVYTLYWKFRCATICSPEALLFAYVITPISPRRGSL